jgi:ComF family protein
MDESVDRVVSWLGGLLLPPRCVLCGAHGQPPALDLCVDCERALPPASPSFVSGPGPLLGSYAAFEYDYPVDHLVQALKYRGQLAVGRVLGTLLGRGLAAHGVARAVDVVVPVPLHPGRHAERSFNQSAELARWVARVLRLRFDPNLAIRWRETRPQVGLHGAERRGNLAGAFVARGGARGLRIAVVDDVTTTGATVAELGQALVAAGAASVVAWCACRAPPPEQVDCAPAPEVRQA